MMYGAVNALIRKMNGEQQCSEHAVGLYSPLLMCVYICMLDLRTIVT